VLRKKGRKGEEEKGRWGEELDARRANEFYFFPGFCQPVIF